MRAIVCRQPLRQAQEIRRGGLEGTHFGRDLAISYKARIRGSLPIPSRERTVLLEELRRKGAEILDSPADQVAARTIECYFELKRRMRL